MTTDVLLDRLAEVLDRLEPLPADLVDRAVALFALRGLDGELLELLEDSAHALDTAGLRSAGDQTCRFVTFQGATSTVELEIDGTAGVMIGAVSPVGRHHVTVQGEGHDADVVTDEFGRFEARWPVGASVRLIVDMVDGTRLVTPAIAI